MKAPLTLLFALLCASGLRAQGLTFSLRNDLGFARRGETVEVSVPEGIDPSACSLRDEAGEAVPFEAAGKGAIRFQASLEAESERRYTLVEGAPLSPRKLTFAGVMDKEQRADIAWENDRAAFRMYSYLLKRREASTGNGIDLWQKKKPEPVLQQMYSLPNYHEESEWGVDGYNVNGLRLGCGAINHVTEGELLTHDPYDECLIVEDGALRSEFVVTYNNVDVGGDLYTKTVRICTTAGSLLNKAVVRYEGAEKTFRLALPIYRHTDLTGFDPQATAYTSTPGLAGWAELPSEGVIKSEDARFYEGAYLPSCETEAEVISDYLCLCVDYTAGTDLVYYFGGGWSVYPEGEYQEDEDWFEALERFRQTVETPIKVIEQ
ncbi:MAG: DUF4861 domain-containing protein [Prevotellaceae bacterium]|nr:DUF4861 domain-containing protein [Prevotellaceae bacterium]